MALPSTVDRRPQNTTSSVFSAYEERRVNLRDISHEIQKLLDKSSTSSPTHDWFYYRKCFLGVLQAEIDEYERKLNRIIVSTTLELTTQTIPIDGKTFQIQWRHKLDNNLQNEPINIDINRLKRRALDMYVNQTMKGEEMGLDNKVSEASVKVLNHFIEEIKYEFESGLRHSIHTSGHEFETVPDVLQRIQLFYRCFLLQLPLFESAKELLNQIKSNTVCTITTTTASGTYRLTG